MKHQLFLRVLQEKDSCLLRDLQENSATFKENTHGFFKGFSTSRIDKTLCLIGQSEVGSAVCSTFWAPLVFLNENLFWRKKAGFAFVDLRLWKFCL